MRPVLVDDDQPLFRGGYYIFERELNAEWRQLTLLLLLSEKSRSASAGILVLTDALQPCILKIVAERGKLLRRIVAAEPLI